MESCGMWMISNAGTAACDCGLFKNPVLRAGCENFLSLGWNNPPVEYEEVDCPLELAQLPCWDDNGGGWPVSSPDLCSDPYALWTPPTGPQTAPPTGTPQAEPTNPPTEPPIAVPTESPQTESTNAPMSAPTFSPTESPNPPTGNDSFCCSWDGLNCPMSSEFCDKSQGNCEGNCSGKWIDPTAPRTCRIPKYGECTHDTTGCCNSTCQGNIYYKQCK